MRSKLSTNTFYSSLSRHQTRQYTLVFVLALVLGTVFRLYRLDYHSLWLDELVTWTVSQSGGFLDMIRASLKAEVTPPGFAILQYWGSFVFDQSEAGVRAVAALSGILCLPAIFFMAKEFYGTRSGLWAMALFAMAYQPVYFSQEARTYSTVILLTCLSSWSWHRLLRLTLPLHTTSKSKVDRGARKDGAEAHTPYASYTDRLSNKSLRSRSKWYQTGESLGSFFRDRQRLFALIMTFVLSTCLSYLHYFGALMVFVQGITWFAYSPPTLRHFRLWLILYGSVVVLYLPWLSIMLKHATGGSFWIQPTKFSEIFIYHRWMFGRSSVLGILSSVAIIAFFLTQFRQRRWQCQSANSSPSGEMILREVLLFSWAFLPFVFGYLISLYKPVLTLRYLVVGLPPFYVLIAGSIDGLISASEKSIWRKLCFALGLLMIVLSGYETVVARSYYKSPKSEQNREATKYVVGQLPRLKDPLVVVRGYDIRHSQYYFRRLGYHAQPDALITEWTDLERLKPLLRGTHSIVYFAPGANGRHDDPFFNFFYNQFNLKDEKLFYRSAVWIFEKGDVN